jgi:epoxyqueuosine reductase
MSDLDRAELTAIVRDKAFELGFDLAGIAAVRPLKEHLPLLDQWCSAGMNAGMTYLCKDRVKRTDPELLFPGAKSVIVAGLNYFSEKKQGGDGIPVLSRYVYGDNYHDVIKRKLNNLLGHLKHYNSLIDGRAFVDSAPLLEKAWAREAGLGWPGRHSILINDRIGSFFFIGILLVTAELEYDNPFGGDKCGKCRLCIEVCPTGAINDDRTIDAGRCISYLTVESKVPVPAEMAANFEGRIFGCDRCQEVCPWNKNASAHRTIEFQIKPELVAMSSEDWQHLSQDQFRILFRKSAIARKKFDTFSINTGIIMNSDREP